MNDELLNEFCAQNINLDARIGLDYSNAVRICLYAVQLYKYQVDLHTGHFFLSALFAHLLGMLSLD